MTKEEYFLQKLASKRETSKEESEDFTLKSVLLLVLSKNRRLHDINISACRSLVISSQLYEIEIYGFKPWRMASKGSSTHLGLRSFGKSFSEDRSSGESIWSFKALVILN